MIWRFFHPEVEPVFPNIFSPDMSLSTMTQQTLTYALWIGFLADVRQAEEKRGPLNFRFRGA